MSKLFGVFDDDGNLLYFGRCANDKVEEQGENSIELFEKPIPGMKYRLVEGALQQIEGDDIVL